MTSSIPQIIGKVNPFLYSSNVKDLLKEGVSLNEINPEKIKEKSLSEHKLVYDCSSETLEPIYFFILDLMNDFGLNAEKLVDNFVSSPGSGHFSELGQKGTIMQQQGMKILGDINSVLRSVLNIMYDLKEFRLRLKQYDDLKTEKKQEATLSLKQIWLDKVDIQKGNSSIKAMALGQAGFQTLLDAFLFVKDIKDIDKVDLNERVKRILKSRVPEFDDWIVNSEKELRKRFEIEKNYLKSQVNSLKLYSRWARPYLKAAQELEMKQDFKEPALVKTFNTILLELTLMGKTKLDTREEALSGNLPEEFEKIKSKDYYSCVLIEFKFRGIPQKISQQPHYVFGGKTEISFKSYVLTGDELDLLNKELENSDSQEVFKLIEGSTGKNLQEIQQEINSFIEEKEEVQEKKIEKDESNPFKALIGSYEKKQDKIKKPVKKGKNLKETFAEKSYVRPLAEEIAKETTFKLFDIYKKAHGMPSYT